jgi:hypothetical protein
VIASLVLAATFVSTALMLVMWPRASEDHSLRPRFYRVCWLTIWLLITWLVIR